MPNSESGRVEDMFKNFAGTFYDNIKHLITGKFIDGKVCICAHGFI